MSGYCPEGSGTCADADAGPCVVGHPCDYWWRHPGRELALKLSDGTIVRDSGWRCVADVMAGFAGFGLDRAVGAIVDAETLVQVYPPEQLMDGTGTKMD